MHQGHHQAAGAAAQICRRGRCPDEPSAEGGPLQEVIVYARRREERIEDTPLAISVRSGEQLCEETSRVRSWEVAVFGNNLADKRYAYTGGTLGAPLAPNPTIAWNIPGARRTAGVEGTYRWKPGR
jgi:outer membrane receptor protein involved in Fe transport